MCIHIHIEERPTINQLLKVMRRESLAMHWYELGVELLPSNNNSLEVIKANHHNDVSTCCREMFLTWLKMKPGASWDQLVAALNEIELGSAAHAVSKKYISGTVCTNMSESE